MPDNRLERLGMWRHARRVHRWDDDHAITDFLGVAAVAPDYAEYLEPALLRFLETRDDVRADVLLEISATHGEHKYRVLCVGVACPQPGCEHRVPAFVVGTRSELGHIVRRRIRLDSAQLAEVIDRMAAVS